VLYVIGPIMTSLLSAALVIGSRRQIGWLLGGTIAAATAIGYCLSRTTGLPHADDDISNWTEPLGVASLIAEGVVVLLAAGYLISRWRPASSTQSSAPPPRPVRDRLGWRRPTLNAEARMPDTNPAYRGVVQTPAELRRR
jgi:hypothetical protein